MASVMKKIFGFGALVFIIFGTFFAGPASAQTEIILQNIAITNPASKLTYIVGDTLDLSGLAVTGTYDDGSTQVETIAEANVSGFDSSAPAIGQILTITLNGKTATYTIDINPAPIPDVLLRLKIQTATETVFDDDITVSPCATPNNPTATINGFCAFESTDLSVDASWSSFGALINSIEGISDPNNFWLWFINGDVAQVGIDSYAPEDGDTILWTLGVQPLKVTVSSTTPVVGDAVTVNVKGFDANAFDFVAVPGATLEGVSATTDENGVATVTATSMDPMSFTVKADGFIDAPEITITPTPPAPISISLKVYSGDTVLLEDALTVTACAESPEDDAPITVNGKCAVEQSGLSNTWTWYDSNFHTVSDLPKTLGILDELGGSASDNTNYIYWGWFSDLNYGNIALNKHLLHADEELLLTYNSYPLRISASENSGVVGEQIIFTVEEKSTFSNDFSDMVWTPSEGASVTIGTQSCATTADGTCSIVLSTAGTLNAVAGKTLHVPSAGIDIEVASVDQGGGSGETPAESWSSSDALNYLKSVQDGDGSFGGDMYTDWTAIAFSAANASGSSKATLINYFASNNSLSSLLTDNERRAMALLALDKNPYSFEGVNYIKAITETFDGTQFGDDDLVNDDIFALIPLKNSGYGENDEMISKSVAFVVSEQSGNGSWVGSVDITAAAVQALKPFESLPGVSEALSEASLYLQGKQKTNGGWEDSISSTSWAMQAEEALGVSWSQNGKSGIDYLATKQTSANNGGSVLSSSESGENNIWATSYALTAASGKTWREIMDTVSKPKIENNDGENDEEEKEPEEKELPAPVEPVAVACPPGDLFNISTGEPCAPTLALSSIPLPANETIIAPASGTALSANVNASSMSNEETKKITEEEVPAPVLTAAVIESFPAPLNNTPETIPLVVGTTTGLMFLLLGLKFLLL